MCYLEKWHLRTICPVIYVSANACYTAVVITGLVYLYASHYIVSLMIYLTFESACFSIWLALFALLDGWKQRHESTCFWILEWIMHCAALCIVKRSTCHHKMKNNPPQVVVPPAVFVRTMHRLVLVCSRSPPFVWRSSMVCSKNKSWEQVLTRYPAYLAGRWCPHVRVVR